MRRLRLREVSPCDSCGASDWVRDSPWVQARYWFAHGGPWGSGPRRCRSCGERVELGGGFGSRALSAPRSGSARIVLAPLWLALALRRSRTLRPVPRTYALAGVAGIALGVALQLASDVRWWLVAAAVVAAAWLGFLATSFRRLRNVGGEFIRMISPRASITFRQRAFADAFRGTTLPLYGLPASWSGPRFLGGHGSDGRVVTSLSLAHGFPFEEQRPQVRVEVSVRPDFPLEFHRRPMFEQLQYRARRPPPDISPEEFSVWVRRTNREIDAREEPEPQAVTMIVDGIPRRFEQFSEGVDWVAWTELDDVLLSVEGHAMPLGEVELVRIRDVNPYIEGSRHMHDEGNAGRGD